jgi:hypothetical protein
MCIADKPQNKKAENVTYKNTRINKRYIQTTLVANNLVKHAENVGNTAFLTS